MSNYKGKRVSVIGFGRSGKACADLLVRMGARVFVSEIDENRKPKTENRDRIEFEFGEHTNRIYDASLIIISPGISVANPMVLEAQRRGIHVLGELEFGYRLLASGECKPETENRKPRIIGITGTNGKTTTVFLIQRILEYAKIDAIMCGNVGVPLSSIVGKTSPNTVLVVEVSTFQLETIESFRPWIGVLLNITADHLDRHKNFEEYKNLKFRLFSNQAEDDFAVLNFDDPNVGAYCNRPLHNIAAQKLFFSFREPATAWVKDGNIFWRENKFCSVEEINLEWECLLQNYLASIIVGKIFDLPNDVIINGLRAFKGVSHRLEEVGVIKGVRFINNSMCTNPTAFVSTLYSFKSPVVLIAGGKRKDVVGNRYICSLQKMAEAINKKVKYGILIGETSEELAKLLKVSYRIASSMDEAVVLAYDCALEGDTILLSPGFASFDWFIDFRDRGEKFKQAVNKLRDEKHR